LRDAEVLVHEHYPNEAVYASMKGRSPLSPGVVMFGLFGALVDVIRRRSSAGAEDRFASLKAADGLVVASTTRGVMAWDAREELVLDLPRAEIDDVRVARSEVSFTGLVLELQSGEDVARIESSKENMRTFAGSLALPISEVEPESDRFWLLKALPVGVGYGLGGLTVLVGTLSTLEDDPDAVMWLIIGAGLLVVGDIARRLLFRKGRTVA
jgi:hypothetical protein